MFLKKLDTIQLWSFSVWFLDEVMLDDSVKILFEIRKKKLNKPISSFQTMFILLSNYQYLLDFFKSKHDSYNYCIVVSFIKGLKIF